MSDTSIDVSEYDGEWNELPEPNAQLPDGSYQATVVGSRTVTANEERWWVLDLRDVNGAGEVTKWSSFDNEVGRRVIKNDSVLMGFDGSGFQELIAAIESGSFDGLVVDINVKTKPGEKRDFTNVYINRSYPRGEQPTPAAQTADDDIPF